MRRSKLGIISANARTRCTRVCSPGLVFPLNPILRSPTAMRDRENPDCFVQDGIRNIVTEYSEVYSPVAQRSKSRPKWIFANPRDRCARLFSQPQAESWFNFLVVGDRVVQFGFCFCDDARVHRPNRRSRSANTSSALRERAVPFSTACKRRTISFSHSTSTSGEYPSLSSDVSRRIRASVRRCAGGSSNASRVTSESTLDMGCNVGIHAGRSTDKKGSYEQRG